MAEQVIDASVAIKWLVQGEPYRHKARQLLREARARGIALIGPPLLVYEVESNLQHRLHGGRITLAAANAALGNFYTVGMQIETHPDMVRRARGIARLYHQDRIYDSLYAALAELRGCEFWTADGAFFHAVTSGLPFVKYLPHYP
jgi:predicted nucleic acid-binding protein